MKLIPLTQGLFAKVDDEDYDYLMKFKWHAHKAGKKFYARRCLSWKPDKKIRMHTQIMNPDNGLVTDHKDEDGLNNQKYNLRNCTRAENGRNRQGNHNALSKYCGVWLDKKAKKKMWGAKILVNKKSVFLGRHLTEESAAKAYDDAAKIYHGEFANLNFK